VAAYAGQPKHWKAFTTAWNATKRPDGIEVYHAVDCANQRNEFEGWSKSDCNAFAAKMIPIIATHPPVGVVIGIDMAAFNEAMAEHPESRELVGTPYACCFQWVVQTILGIIEQHSSNERLAFFHEQNDYQREAHDARPVRRAWTALDPERNRITMKRYGHANMHILIRRLSTLQEEIKTFGRPLTFLNEPSPPKRSSS
jgi:hypothetical protein